MKAKIIGISGIAQAGKDTFVSIAKEILIKNGYVPYRIAFADTLKKEVQEMLLQNNFTISAYVSDFEQKKNIRPLLVWWGCQRRRESVGGYYWVSKAEEHMRRYLNSVEFANQDINKQVILVSDVRFKNESTWIKEYTFGKVIHLKRFKYISLDNSQIKKYDDPPNDEERRNDPIVNEMSDLKIEWESMEFKDMEVAVNNSYLKNIVLNSLNELNLFEIPLSA